MDFDMMGFSPKLVSRLADLGLTEPTPIQKKAIPPVMQGRDVMGLAQTGTGKTAAFGLPLIHALATENRRAAPKTASALILAPTRELAGQIVDSLTAFAGGKGAMRIGLVVGGRSINPQITMLSRGIDILVATPGRLVDLIDRRAVDLGRTGYLVLDEADQMLDLGFIHALRRIAPLLSRERQTLLFSATMPKQMADLSRAYLTDPVRIDVSPPGRAADKVEQSVHFIPQAEKQSLLVRLLDDHRNDRALVFARTKRGAERLMKHLDQAGFAAASIHGNKSQGQRDRALASFRTGDIRVLVATDVAARGIDIPGVGHVYNYELPNVPENYVHRIGRTARAGASGRAVAFCAPEEMSDFHSIEKLLGDRVTVAGGRRWQELRESRPAASPKGRQRRRGNGRPAARAA